MTETEPSPPPPRGKPRVLLVIIGGVVALAVLVIALYLSAAARSNHIALSESRKPVSVVKAKRAIYRPTRNYVGTIQPWNSARVGPQLVSAYVGAVVVRPGAQVKRGDVLATLDCRESSAASRETAARARAQAERQLAAAHEAERLRGLEAGGFASANDAEQLQARSKSQESEAEALRASLAGRTLAVDDCVLRAPFAGEVSERSADPGAYVRPGQSIVTLVDRGVVRVVGDAPESDFAAVAPGTAVAIEVVAISRKLSGTISRRAPAAEEQSRTVHFEIDLPNADRSLPVGTTALMAIEIGQPQPAIAVPLQAATQRGEGATLFVVEGDIARRTRCGVLGEVHGTLYLDTSLKDGSLVVVEGRALLDDGDRVAAKELSP